VTLKCCHDTILGLRPIYSHFLCIARRFQWVLAKPVYLTIARLSISKRFENRIESRGATEKTVSSAYQRQLNRSSPRKMDGTSRITRPSAAVVYRAEPRRSTPGARPSVAGAPPLSTPKSEAIQALVRLQEELKTVRVASESVGSSLEVSLPS
jgi:hypothetical protein